eukprot:13001047-Alexandrium_andersonii.AAC.1
MGPIRGPAGQGWAHSEPSFSHGHLPGLSHGNCQGLRDVRRGGCGFDMFEQLRFQFTPWL